MKDVIKQYRKHKRFSTMSIVVSSLVIALGINFFVLNPSVNTGNLKVSVLDSNQAEERADIFLESNDDNIVLKSSKNLNNIKNLTLSLVYNPENVSLSEYVSTVSSEVNNFSNIKGIDSVIIDFPNNKSFTAGEEILKLKSTKVNEVSEQLNIVNANFIDNEDQTYLLSTSGITF